MIKPFDHLPDADVDALSGEGERLLRFAAGEAQGYDIRFAGSG